MSPTSTRGRGRGASVRRGQRLRFRGVPRGSRRGRQNRRQPRNANPELQWSRDAGIHTAPQPFTEPAPGPSRRFVNPENNPAKFYFDLLFCELRSAYVNKRHHP